MEICGYIWQYVIFFLYNYLGLSFFFCLIQVRLPSPCFSVKFLKIKSLSHLYIHVFLLYMPISRRYSCHARQNQSQKSHVDHVQRSQVFALARLLNFFKAFFFHLISLNSSFCLYFLHLRSKAWISLFYVYLRTLKRLPLYSLVSLKTIKSNFIYPYPLIICLQEVGFVHHLTLSRSSQPVFVQQGLPASLS